MRYAFGYAGDVSVVNSNGTVVWGSGKTDVGATRVRRAGEGSTHVAFDFAGVAHTYPLVERPKSLTHAFSGVNGARNAGRAIAKLLGYTSRSGGWIYRPDGTTVCQGYASLAHSHGVKYDAEAHVWRLPIANVDEIVALSELTKIRGQLAEVQP